MIRHVAVLALSLCTLAACEKPQPVRGAPGSAAPGSPPAMSPVQKPAPIGPVSTAAKPTGPSPSVEPVDGDDIAVAAASVTQIHTLRNGAKVFSTSRAEASHGLYLYIALGRSDDRRVFPITSCRAWKVVEEAQGAVVIDVFSGSQELPGTPERPQKLIVQYAGEGATSITVTPAG